MRSTPKQVKMELPLIVLITMSLGCGVPTNAAPTSDGGTANSAEACTSRGDESWTCTPEEHPFAFVRASEGAVIALDEHRALIVDGVGSGGSKNAIFDTRTGSVTAAPALVTPRVYPRLLRLDDGSVLAFGGHDTVERFDGTSWSVVAQTDHLHRYLTVYRLSSDLALVSDFSGNYAYFDTVEFEFQDAGRLPFDDGIGVVAPLPDGGLIGFGSVYLGDGEICPISEERAWIRGPEEQWRPFTAPKLHSPPEVLVLDDGRLLLASGQDCDIGSGIGAVYDPAGGTFTMLSEPITWADDANHVELPDGRILIGRTALDLDSHATELTDFWGPRAMVGCTLVAGGYDHVTACTNH